MYIALILILAIVVGFLKKRMTNSEGHLVSLNVSRSGSMDREMHLNVFSQSSFSNAKEGDFLPKVEEIKPAH